jgi:radical SAM protein with 4Fe4S-binding SPASM domain
VVYQPHTIPYKHRILEHDSHKIILAPENGSWIITDTFGALLFEKLARGVSPKDLFIETVREHTTSVAEAREILRRIGELLSRLEESGWLKPPEFHEEPAEPDLQILMTRECNLGCVHCQWKAGPAVRGVEPELTTDDMLRVVEEFRSITSKGTVSLSGGEPLLRKDVVSVLRRAKELSLGTELLSNGTLISPQILKELEPVVDLLQISLDGATESINDQVRGRGSFVKICRAIELVRETGITLRIAVTINPDNAKDIQENICNLSDLFSGEDCHLHFGVAQPNGRAAERWPKEAFTPLMSIARAVRRDLHKRGLKPEGPPDQKKRINCGFGPRMMVRWDGSVRPCDGEDAPNMGNVRNLPLPEIYEKVHALYSATSVDQIPECKECDFRYICKGGCRINNLKKNGSYLATGCTPRQRENMLATIIRNSPSSWTARDKRG